MTVEISDVIIDKVRDIMMADDEEHRRPSDMSVFMMTLRLQQRMKDCSFRSYEDAYYDMMY